MPFYVYILKSETTDRYYIGQTEHLQERVSYHNANYSKSLKNRGPWRLAYHEIHPTRGEAIRRERQIKSWKDRKLIEKLISASR